MKIHHLRVMLGADPEIFIGQKRLRKGPYIVGAERVIPAEGLSVLDYMDRPVGRPLVIIDGIQAEFNPQANTCRQSLASSVSTCFSMLKKNLKRGMYLDFRVGVPIEEAEMAALDPKNQQFGCTPSLNAYDPSPMPAIDASKFFFRAAGGHVHLGISAPETRALFTAPGAERMVRLLDVLLGNTMVLIDRDEANAKRRELYGKAGEYRLPAHGLEYRTLSNFWLRDYRLMSLVFGLARFAVAVAGNEEASGIILESVDLEKIRKAINTNDFDLALENFNAIKEVIRGIERIDLNSSYEPYYPLEGKYMDAFDLVVKHGIEHYITDDPVAHWTSTTFMNEGWEYFAERITRESAVVASPIKVDTANAPTN